MQSVANEAIAQDVFTLENVFIASKPAADDRKTTWGYIQPSDLLECLTDYFEGTLDQVNNEVLYLDCWEWHSGNSLWGQVDSVTMAKAIASLPAAQSAAITYYFAKSFAAQNQLIECFTRQGQEVNFIHWQSLQYGAGLIALGDRLREML
jgi:hypothetical protein